MPDDVTPNVSNVEDINRARGEGRTEALGFVNEVRRSLDLAGITDREFETRCLAADGISAARALIIDEVARRNAGPVAGDHGQGVDPRVRAGQDEREKVYRAMELSIHYRAGLITDAEARRAAESEYCAMRLPELARICLERSGQPYRGFSTHDMIAQALHARSTIGHGISDFTNLLAGTFGAALLLGYTEAPTTWRRIARSVPLQDFKQTDLAGLSEFSDLEQVDEAGEYKYGTFGDRKEVIQLKSYGKLFSLGRAAIINDNLGAFNAIPRKMGRAADRGVNAAVYGVLTANAALNQDSTALFHANHSNIGTSGVISLTTVGEMRTLLALQSDSSSSADALNIDLSLLIVPKTIESTANVLRASEYDPSDTGNTRSPNPERNRFEVVADAILDQTSTAVWYGSANPNIHDTLIAGFLNGAETPTLSTEAPFTVDGVVFKVAHDWAAIAGDFRGLARNAGV